MAMTYHLLRENPDVSNTTGLHTIEVSVHEHHDDGSIVNGVMEKYGISLAEINQRFDGDIEKWLAWVGRDMLAKHKARQGVHMELLAKHRTKAPIPDDSATVLQTPAPILQAIPKSSPKP